MFAVQDLAKAVLHVVVKAAMASHLLGSTWMVTHGLGVKADSGLSMVSLYSCSRESSLHRPEVCHPVCVTWARPAI